MIPILLRDLRWRLALVFVICILLYFLEPSFHQHEEVAVDPEVARELGPLGISATLAYLAGLAMIVLLAGFVSTDRREGYARMYFSHPTSPLAYYSLRWALALGVALTASLVFLLVGQTFAWGEFRGGGSGMLLALLAGLVYGGLMAFLSVALPRGDAWIAFLLFIPTFLPPSLLESTLPRGLHRTLLFVGPPQTALQDVYQGLLLDDLAWGSVLYVVGYATVWIVAAVLVLRLREWS